MLQPFWLGRLGELSGFGKGDFEAMSRNMES
jgi:hypothetical protein